MEEEFLTLPGAFQTKRLMQNGAWVTATQWVRLAFPPPPEEPGISNPKAEITIGKVKPTGPDQASMATMRGTWRPPSNGVARKVSTIFLAMSRVTMR